MSRHRRFEGMDVPPKVSLEISAFCNRKCPWCPQHDQPRKQELLPMELIEKVVRELTAVGFDGTFGFHLFNEPLCDPRLVDIVDLTRKALPSSELYFHSNGDVVTAEKFRALLAVGLDRITFNQYEGKPNENFLAFLAVLTDGEKAHLKWRIFRKHNIFNRAGLVETKRSVPLERQCRRIHQMCINYRGDVVLCCNAYLGQVCVGNVRDRGVIALYNDPVLKRYREQLAEGHRAGLKLCDKCDLFG